MANVPVISGTRAVGIYQVCTVANTDYVITIPEGAFGFVLWFETSAASNTIIGGRVAIGDTNTVVAGLTGIDDKLGYQPALSREYTIDGIRATDTARGFLHVANPVALSVVRGSWLFRR